MVMIRQNTHLGSKREQKRCLAHAAVADQENLEQKVVLAAHDEFLNAEECMRATSPPAEQKTRTRLFHDLSTRSLCSPFTLVPWSPTIPFRSIRGTSFMSLAKKKGKAVGQSTTFDSSLTAFPHRFRRRRHLEKSARMIVACRVSVLLTRFRVSHHPRQSCPPQILTTRPNSPTRAAHR
jgi:hypothetical protein